MSHSFLENLGLTQKEAEIYELLLKLGEVPAQIIIKESKLKRATAYKVLYSLEQKGLVSKKDIQKKIHFRPEQPTKLLELAENQYQSLERAKGDLQTILPQLTSEYILSVEKPVVRIYEGIAGVKRAYLDSLSEKKEILAYVYVSDKLDKPLEDFWPVYYKMRLKSDIHVRSICPDNREGREYQKKDIKELRETRLVSQEAFPITIEKNIVGNKVFFFSRSEGKLLATSIENEAIAETERAIFELAWDQAGEIQSKKANAKPSGQP